MVKMPRTELTSVSRTRYRFYLLIFSAVWICADAASNSLTSSLDQGSGQPRSACPGEEVTYTCTIVDLMGIAVTVWEGSAFDCPDDNNLINLIHSDFNNTGGIAGQCGALTAQSQSVDGDCYTSVLTVPGSAVTDELSGATIECSLSALIDVGEKTLIVISLPAPTITVTELTPENVRVSVTDYPEESEQCVTNFIVEETSGTMEMKFSEPGLSVDFSLNLCTSTYTFVGQVMSSSISSPTSPSVEFSADLRTLDCDTNLRCDRMCENDPQSLLWDAPTNLPSDCSVAYQIEVDGEPNAMTTTMATTINVADLGLPVPLCGVYTVTVTPNLTDRIGPVERCSSEVTITLTQGLPSPSITTIDILYRQQDINVTIVWLGEDATLIEAVMVDCGNTAVCQPVNLTNPMGIYSTNLDYSDVIGEDVDFIVSFINDLCETTTDTITTNFPQLLESARASRTDRTSADILVVYNTDVILEGTFVLCATIMERVTGEQMQMNETFPLTPATGTENQFVFMFTGLTDGAIYDLDVRVVNGDGQTIGRVESGSFTATEEPSSSSAAAIGGAVGAVLVVVLVILVVNLLLVVFLYWGSLSCCLVVSSEVEAGVGATSGAFADKDNHGYKIHTCILILLVFLVVTLPFVIYFYCCWRNKSGSPKTDDKVELNVRTGSESGDTQSSPEATGGGDLNYAVPSDIKREEFPGTHEEYTVVDKSRKKLKPEDTQPTYAAPDTIPREKAPATGDLYTVPDKAKKGSWKQASAVPPPEEPALVYSEADKSKKQPGVMYADVDLPGSNTVPPQPPRVDYSSVQY